MDDATETPVTADQRDGRGAPSTEDPKADGAARDHGGDLDRAIARFGGARSDWLDLSTGVNPEPYPFAPPPLESWARLPDAGAEAALLEAARARYGAPAGVEIVATPGAQAAIQAAPRLWPVGRAAVVSPTYNEHAAAFRAAGWTVREVSDPEAAAPDEALAAVNPNNPDGRRWPAARLAAHAARAPVLLDESFADVAPEVSAVGALGAPGLLVLRSFGKFYGLAGLRLGFALGAPETIARLRTALGPWAVSGPALAIGAAALADEDWAAAALQRLEARAARIDAAVAETGRWRVVGGTPLFRLVETGDAEAAQIRLAEHGVWTRRFPYSVGWLRIGPPAEGALPRLLAAIAAAAAS